MYLLALIALVGTGWFLVPRFAPGAQNQIRKCSTARGPITDEELNAINRGNGTLPCPDCHSKMTDGGEPGTVITAICSNCNSQFELVYQPPNSVQTPVFGQGRRLTDRSATSDNKHAQGRHAHDAS